MLVSKVVRMYYYTLLNEAKSKRAAVRAPDASLRPMHIPPGCDEPKVMVQKHLESLAELPLVIVTIASV